MIFLNYDLIELEIQDNYKKPYMIMFLSISYDCVFEYCSSYSKEAATGGVL